MMFVLQQVGKIRVCFIFFKVRPRQWQTFRRTLGNVRHFVDTTLRGHRVVCQEQYIAMLVPQCCCCSVICLVPDIAYTRTTPNIKKLSCPKTSLQLTIRHTDHSFFLFFFSTKLTSVAHQDRQKSCRRDRKNCGSRLHIYTTAFILFTSYRWESIIIWSQSHDAGLNRRRVLRFQEQFNYHQCGGMGVREFPLGTIH